MKIQIEKKLFQFESFDDWCNNPHMYSQDACGYPIKFTISIDSGGFVCLMGKQFMAARDKNRFPISVYLLKGAI